MEILRKQHQAAELTVGSVDGRQHEGPPRQFEDVELFFGPAGRGLDARKVERAVAMSEERYCAVIATIRGVAQGDVPLEVPRRRPEAAAMTGP